MLGHEEYVALRAAVDVELRAAHQALRQEIAATEESEPNRHEEARPIAIRSTPVTAVSAFVLRRLNEDLLRVPPGFTVHPKLAEQLARRERAIEQGGVDFGQAEALAFASLLADGVPIRLTGQDVERGTFSHRHLVLHAAETGAPHAPIQHLSQARTSFEVRNSPLSEYAALGFEYGYAVATPEALVLWEAQFGDFANGAQIVIDQFIASGFSKWGESSRLTLLLPHGYEGNGPEHSSARIDRFLQLAAENNLRIANPTTSAQYFHLLRRQALEDVPRPLVVFTPKGLLRSPVASSTLHELATGSFQVVLGDAEAASPFAELCDRLLGPRVLRPGRAAAGARTSRRPDRPCRAALSVPARRASGDARRLPEPRGARLGTRRAAEHGPRALDPPPARSGSSRRGRASLRRPPPAGEPE